MSLLKVAERISTDIQAKGLSIEIICYDLLAVPAIRTQEILLLATATCTDAKNSKILHDLSDARHCLAYGYRYTKIILLIKSDRSCYKKRYTMGEEVYLGKQVWQ